VSSAGDAAFLLPAIKGGVCLKSLQDPVGCLKGVGPKTVEALATLDIKTVEDLLTYFPSRYDDFAPTDLSTAKDRQKVTVHGTVSSEPILTRYGYRRNRLSFRLLVDRNVVLTTFFNQPYLKNSIILNTHVTVQGKWDAVRQQILGSKLFTQNQERELGAIYPANKHVSQKTLRKLIKQAYDQYKDVIATLLPISLRQRYQLMERREMIKQMHWPTTPFCCQAGAKKTAAYEEFFLFQLRLQAIRRAHRQDDGNQILYNNQELKEFIKTIPFELTDAQKRSVNEICRDPARALPDEPSLTRGRGIRQNNRCCAGNCGHGQCWLPGCFDGADRDFGGPACCQTG
jgi:ATP-dependent DNA helicase RecG